MSTILYNIIISPIELIVEVIFELMFRLVGQRETNQGLAVIGVSVAISLLTLPLYHNADVVQQKQRIIQKKMEHWVNHIRKTFKGDERFMMLNTYYRQNDYSPIMALRGSVSLLLEIPFFIAAYHFLSNLKVLEGASFGPIVNLGTPDALIRIGTISLNLLPILMTSINCISSAIYLKGFPIKDKIQTYGMALIFLVLLYNSPSGLVVYWTCNNIFSLIKNILYKIKNPKKVISIVSACAGTIITIALFSSGILNSKKKYIATILLLFITYVPLLISFINKYHLIKHKEILNSENTKKDNSLFFFSVILLTILTGILIPSAVIVSSPAEFIDINNYRNPLHYLVQSLSYSVGFFIVWATVIYKMLDYKSKKILSVLFFIVTVISIINYMCFSRNLGIISPTLRFDNPPVFSKTSILINSFIIFIIITAILLLLLIFKSKVIHFFKYLTIILIISISSVSFINIGKIQSQLSKMKYIKNLSNKGNEIEPIFHLSKNGKNVIVFMLDRAINGFFPLCLEEKPELVEQFSGFTYYPNTISFGAHTIFGSAPLFGGYEYTPRAINERKDKTLVEKQNEALKVLPVLFMENNFQTTVCDPPFANYKWIPDVSIYDDYPQIQTHITEGRYFNALLQKYNIDGSSSDSRGRNFFSYSLFKIVPIAAKNLIYDEGDYFSTNAIKENDFYDNYAVLDNLSKLTVIEEATNNFIMIDNDTTHFPCKLYLPDYTIFSTSAETSQNDDNRFQTENQLIHYHANMASLLALGRWFDYLKENDVYDNTKIIIVADHGYTNSKGTESLGYFENMKISNPEIDVMMINPLLLVKDFDAKELTFDNTFMTNGDVPEIATKEVIEKAVNPFTGKLLSSAEKNAHPQYITSCHNVLQNENDTVFDLTNGHWYSVQDNIFDEKNWELVE